MLLILRPQTTFQMLAQALVASTLDLVNVRSCTFPSRPEPKQAQWSGLGGVVIAYCYEPDIELRYLWQCGQWPKHLKISIDAYFHQHISLFDNWTTLSQDLQSASYPHMLRAAAAWKVRALRGENAQVQQGALTTLLDTLKTTDLIHTKRVVAMQLGQCAKLDLLPQLKDLLHAQEDLQTRLYLRETIEQLQARQLF